MNRIDFSQGNGFPLKADTLGFMQETYASALNALCKLAGNTNVIISGCIDNGTTVSDGWVFYGGELFRFQGGLKASLVIVDEQITSDTNQNGVNVPRYFERVLKFGSGSNSFQFSSLVRVESIMSLSEKNAFFLIEKNVILSGCDVTVNGSDIDITAGVAMLDGKWFNVPPFYGTFPVYFGDNGSWTNNATAVNNLYFDPFTSQRLGSVYKRATTMQGEIFMQAVSLSDFDPTGLGIWNYLGFALCNGQNGTIDLRGRMPIGFDERQSDPQNGIWDSIYNSIGQTGGEKEHTLTIAEMPRHNHQVDGDPNGAKYQDSGSGDFGLIQKTVVGQNRVAASTTATGSGSKPDVVHSPAYIPFQGSNAPHENRPPFHVLAYLQRI